MPTPSPPSSAAAGAPSASPSSVPSYHDEVDPARYDDMLAAKVARLRDRFASLLRRGDLEVEPEVFPSPPEHFRSRCRFAVAPGGGARDSPEDPARDATADATADPIAVPGPPPRSALFYRMFDAGVPTGPIERFPMALEPSTSPCPPCWTPSPRTPPGNSPPVSRAPISSPRGAGEYADHPPLLTTHRRRVARGGGERRANDYEPRSSRVGVRGRPRSGLETGEDVGTRRRDDPELNSRALNVQGRSKRCATARRRSGSRGGTSAAERRAGVDVQATGGRAFSNPNAFAAESTLDWLCDCSRTTVAAALGSRTPGTNPGTEGTLPSVGTVLRQRQPHPWRSRDCTRTSRRWS